MPDRRAGLLNPSGSDGGTSVPGTDFDSAMPKTLATAAVDRLLHHAHIVLTEGSSLRLTQATSGQGVIPLAS
ncbi:hypothetical protein BIV23_43500 [Streptomyces monashensis]|uniref:IstB-like ATP-binding domain-containing protein n=1 Tax=Streptomyces monashensis TaxID=1678012 RepID=A0A1S2NZ93_9ACTN|nr:hypothetical protein BIV23_43500 [Streptomyces monashensis]